MRIPQVVRAGLAVAPVLVVLGAGACAKPDPMPPVTPAPTQQAQVGMFVWHDLFTSEPDRAQAFYGSLFGWRFQEVPGLKDYTLAILDGRPVAGIVRSGKAKPAVWISHLSVSNVDSAVDLLTSRNGKVLAGARDVPGRGRVAVVTDEMGATLALTRAAGGDPPDVLAPENAFFWTELWAHDPPAHVGLYRGLVSYGVETRPVDLGDYTILTVGGRPRAGVIQSPYKDVPATWLPLVRVTDAPGYAARAQELGGKVIIQPSSGPRGGTAALLVDPDGAPFGIQQWPLPNR